MKHLDGLRYNEKTTRHGDYQPETMLDLQEKRLIDAAVFKHSQDLLNICLKNYIF